MRRTLPSDPAYQGLLHYHPGPRSDIPFQSRISCEYHGMRFDMIDVDPWGLILPLEALEFVGKIFYDIDVETLGMPARTLLGVRWSPHDGKDVHTLTRELSGDDEIITRLRIPAEWLLEAQGRKVLIECEVSLPNGEVLVGRRFDVEVSKQLEHGHMSVGDLLNAGPFNPHDYPDGIPVVIEPIRHIREYNTLTFDWLILANLQDGGFEIVHEFEASVPGKPGEAYELLLPPEAYEGLDDPRFKSATALARRFTRLTPWPGQQFIYASRIDEFNVVFAPRK